LKERFRCISRCTRVQYI